MPARSSRNRLLYLSCWGEWRPEAFPAKVPGHWLPSACPIHQLGDVMLESFDVIYVPGTHDQVFLASQTERLVGYLAQGGNFIVNGHIAIPWLPFLSRFQAVPPRPFTNLDIRPAEPGRYFGRMDYATYHRHEGILGQYARGWSDPPEGAQWLSLIGPSDDPKPVDWVWRYPGGGNLFVHNGDSIHWFCSEPGDEPNLLHDIIAAIVQPDREAAESPRRTA